MLTNSYLSRTVTRLRTTRFHEPGHHHANPRKNAGKALLAGVLAMGIVATTTPPSIASTVDMKATQAMSPRHSGEILVSAAAVGDGSPTDPNVRHFGRWNTANAAAHVSEWAGAYLVVGFTGRTVKLKQRNAIDFFVSIDGRPDTSYVNRAGTVDLTPTPLAAGNHTLRVSYRPVAGSYRGDAVYRGIEMDSGARTFAPPAPPKVVEFVGDSITVGQQSSKQALTAYGWLVGERLGVGHTQIAVGGACLVSAADGCLGMSDRFLRTGLQTDAANWDFSRYRADVVVINLGTNDVGHSVSKDQFRNAYVTLLRRAREKYPTATIIALQTFRKRFIPETQAAVRTVGDAKTMFVTTDGWIVEATDTTDNVHPNDQGHRKIADRLAPIVSAALNR